MHYSVVKVSRFAIDIVYIVVNMKRLKRAKVSITVVDGGRKRKKSVPLKNVVRTPRTGTSTSTSSQSCGDIDVDTAMFDDQDQRPRSSKDQFRKNNLFVNWQNIASDLTSSYFDGCHLPLNSKCVVCAEKSMDVMATVRCFECGPKQFYCMDCAQMIHEKRHHFHVMDVWKVSNYV